MRSMCRPSRPDGDSMRYVLRLRSSPSPTGTGNSMNSSRSSSSASNLPATSGARDRVVDHGQGTGTGEGGGDLSERGVLAALVLPFDQGLAAVRLGEAVPVVQTDLDLGRRSRGERGLSERLVHVVVDQRVLVDLAVEGHRDLPRLTGLGVLHPAVGVVGRA